MQLCGIALCTDMPGMSVWPGTRPTSRAFQHIGAHAAIEIKWPYLFSQQRTCGIDDPGNTSLYSNCNQCLFTDSL